MEISKELRYEFNRRFASGEQYIEINQRAQDTTDDAPELQVIEPTERRYYWEQRTVYNKILPIIEELEVKFSSEHDKKKWKEMIYGENGLVERLIPLQRAYNAMKNRKNEMLDRMSVGTIVAEDGSLDFDDLSEEGIAPGKVIIYRHGSTAPSFVPVDSVEYDICNKELSILEREMEVVVDHFELMEHLNLPQTVGD